MQALLRGRIRPQPEVWRIFLVDTTLRILQDRRIQMLFVAKIIIHGGDVRLGPLANVADGGGAEAVLRKDLTRRLQQPLARFSHRWIGACGIHPSNLLFKLLYETSV